MGATLTTPGDRARPWLVPLAGVALAGGYGAVLSYSMGRHGADLWMALVVVPVLVLATVPVAVHMARRHGDPTLAALLLGALLLKFVAAGVRWYVGVEVYGGFDAVSYLVHGERLAELYRAGQVAVEDLERPLLGTGFLRGVSGVVQAVIGPTKLGASMVFAWMGFMGMVAFAAAFATAVPDGLVRRYTALVLLLPSLLYWPASVGKDAWMMLTLGVGAWGAARVISRRRGGYPLLLLGAAGASMVRPHIALLLVVAATLGYALRHRRAERPPVFGPLGKVAGLAALAVGSFFVLGEVEEFFGVTADPQGVEAVLDETEKRTSQGGSEFEAEQVDNPLELPQAAVTVLMRPFPWEAHNLPARLSSLEGLFLIGLVMVSWRRLANLPWLVRRSPWVALAGVYVLMFIAVFSSMGNFGILARQRVQVLPFFLALLCVPALIRRMPRRDARNWDREASEEAVP